MQGRPIASDRIQCQAFLFEEKNERDSKAKRSKRETHTHSKKETLRKLQVCYNDTLRYLMGIQRSSRISGYFVSLRIPTFDELIRKNIVSLFQRLKESNNMIIRAVFDSEYFKKSLFLKKWSERIFCNI